MAASAKSVLALAVDNAASEKVRAIDALDFDGCRVLAEATAEDVVVAGKKFWSCPRHTDAPISRIPSSQRSPDDRVDEVQVQPDAALQGALRTRR